MRSNISFVTLGVNDVELATAFYTSLGLTKHPRSNDHITFFDMSGQVFALFGREALAEDANLQDTQPSFGGITLAHNVASAHEVTALLNAAADAGGTVLREASEPPWGGLRGYFADPDGHPWEVAWNPGVNIDDDGRVHLPS
jgi:predicted lactoylglutathione lyase